MKDLSRLAKRFRAADRAMESSWRASQAYRARGQKPPDADETLQEVVEAEMDLAWEIERRDARAAWIDGTLYVVIDEHSTGPDGEDEYLPKIEFLKRDEVIGQP